MEKRYYIAYGSNLNIRQMRMRCPSAFQGQQNRLLPYGGKEVRRLSSCCCMGSHRRG